MGYYLGGEIFEDGGEVDGGAGADALGVTAFLEVTADSADGELEAGLDGARDGLLLGPAAASASGAFLQFSCSGIHWR